MIASLRALWYRLRARVRRDALDAELADELAVHRAYLEDEARSAGASPDDARRAAARRLGNGTAIRERTREAWSLAWLDALLLDTRYAVRFLRRSPGFTTVAVLSLALGIGANAAVFTVADKLLFSAPAHVADPGHLYAINVKRVYDPKRPGPFIPVITFPEFFALKDQGSSFAAAVTYIPPSAVRLGRGPDAPRIRESKVDSGFFDILGVTPARGRFFLPDDNDPARPDRAAVISYAYWKRHYAGADSAIGARFTTSGLDFVVVGVAPPEFTGVEMDAADVWVPLAVSAPTRIGPNWRTWDGYSPHAIVRLREGVEPSAADAEATLILRRMPEPDPRRKIERTVQLGSIIPARGPSEQTAAVKVSLRLVIASLLVLFAACANLANLLLVRALSRRRELALRLAVGISRARLAGQIVLESLLLALLGATVALVVARWGGAALRTLVFPQLQWATGTVDLRVFGFAVVCGTVLALIASVPPAVRMTRADVATALRSAAPQLTASTGRLRQGLLALQVALSVLLIVGATAFARSLGRAYAFDMGVDLDRVVIARFGLETDSLNPASRLDMLDEAARRARLVPGVERATVAPVVPLTGNRVTLVYVPEREGRNNTLLWDVTPELQGVLGFRLTGGRWITEADVAPGMTPPVLASETMARTLWPGANPLGHCVRFGADTAPCQQVVGVVRDLRQRSFREDAQMAALRGAAAPVVGGFFSGYVVMRTTGLISPGVVAAAVRRSLVDLRPDLSAVSVVPLAQSLDREYQPLQLGTAAFGSFAALTVILSAIGLYGILAFSVAQRTAEFGIRSALGAQAWDLVRQVVGEGLVVVVVGLAVGSAVSWYASKAINSLLFEASARSSGPFTIAVVVLGVVALAAAAIPARRATRVDPATALRAE